MHVRVWRQKGEESIRRFWPGSPPSGEHQGLRSLTAALYTGRIPRRRLGCYRNLGRKLDNLGGRGGTLRATVTSAVCWQTACKMEHLLDALARKAEKRFPNAMHAASAQALDQDDAEAEEGRRFKQVDMIDEIRIECREDKDDPNDPLKRPGSSVRR
jgi:hypothetical protein